LAQNTREPADPLRIALTHRCPACEETSLYQSLLTPKSQCEFCNLNLAEHDIGDGPAFFTITLLGFVVVGLAFALEIYVHPPYWMHALVVLGAMAILTPLSLRFFKSYLIAMKYKHHWSQGVK